MRKECSRSPAQSSILEIIYIQRKFSRALVYLSFYWLHILTISFVWLHPCCRQSPPPSPRRSINDLKFQIKFIIPNALTGAVMGKGGDNVSRIRDATGAFIQASRTGSAVLSYRDRMITIAGDTPSSAKSAVRMLLQSLKDQGVLDRLERVGYSSGRLFLKQVIPAPCAGKVLGPGGDQIQSINMSSGASVVVEAKPANAAFIPFRYVNYMAPTLERLADAVDMVSDLLSQDERYLPAIREINSVAFKVVQIPEKKAGSLLGPGGAYIQTLQDVMRVKMGICEGNKPGSRYVAVWGSPTNVNVAMDVIAVATGGVPKGAADWIQGDVAASDYNNSAEEGTESEDNYGSSSNGSGRRAREQKEKEIEAAKVEKVAATATVAESSA